MKGAADAYADALRWGRRIPYVRRMVAAADIRPDATPAPTDYVRRVSDGYADRLEPHPISLGYRIPGVMRDAVRAHLLIDADSGGLGQGSRGKANSSSKSALVLDPGCGTGLAAVALLDLPLGPWVVFDLPTAHAEAGSGDGP